MAVYMGQVNGKKYKTELDKETNKQQGERIETDKRIIRNKYYSNNIRITNTVW